VDAFGVSQLPITSQTLVTAELCDLNGHLTVRHQAAIFDDAAWNFLGDLGLGKELVDQGRSFFDLEQHVRYLAEGHVGDTLSIRHRLLDISTSTLHFMAYLFRDTDQVVLSTLETLTLSVDLDQRKAARLQDGDVERLLSRGRSDRSLEWDPCASGCMTVRNSLFA